MPVKAFHLDEVHALADRALGNGGRQHSASVVSWDISNGCEAPVERWVCGKPSPDPVKGGRDVIIRPGKTPHTLNVDINVRCRKCPACLRARARLWAVRAQAETMASVRTWLVTLTLSPDEHVKAWAAAHVKNDARGVDLDATPSHQQFAARIEAIGPDLTKYIKRIRATCEGKLRYLLVAEPHKSGLPHFHMLVHETSEHGVTSRNLEGKWSRGTITGAKLVRDVQHATYICKYLSKALDARVRASRRYGLVPVTVLGDSWNNVL